MTSLMSVLTPELFSLACQIQLHLFRDVATCCHCMQAAVRSSASACAMHIQDCYACTAGALPATHTKQSCLLQLMAARTLKLGVGYLEHATGDHAWGLIFAQFSSRVIPESDVHIRPSSSDCCSLRASQFHPPTPPPPSARIACYLLASKAPS